MRSDALWAEAQAMAAGELAEPWQSRAVALAVETVRGLGVVWDDFRDRLIAAIDADRERSYYDAWLDALELLAVEHGATAEAELAANRMRAASYRIDEAGHGDLEVYPLALTETRLVELLTEVFTGWWRHIRFGTLVDGAVYELRAPHRPRLSLLDGYLTIEFEDWHLHLCVGEHRGDPDRPVDPALARRRRCAHAELQRQWVDGAPRTWMFRMFNGVGAQQLTVLLPNPFLDDDQQLLDAPDWSRLALWDRLRARHLGLPADPADRLGTRFLHA